MSALRGIAFGLVDLRDCDIELFARLKREARKELLEHKLMVTGCNDTQRAALNSSMRPHTGGYHALRRTRWNLARPEWGRPYGEPITIGSFQHCCRAAMDIIEPSNPER